MKKSAVFFVLISSILVALEAFAFGGGGHGRTAAYYNRHNKGVDAYGIHYHGNSSETPDIHFVDGDDDENGYWDEHGVKQCNPGYFLNDKGICVVDLCADFYPTDCALSCDSTTGKKSVASEGTSCGNGLGTCNDQGGCNCPWDDELQELLDNGDIWNPPYLGRDGHTCCVDGYKFRAAANDYVEPDIPVCGCPVDYYNWENVQPHLGTDGITCCSGAYAWARRGQLWDYFAIKPTICGCPEATQTPDARSDLCLEEGEFSVCLKTDSTGTCTNWTACPQNNIDYLDVDGTPNATGRCVEGLLYPTGSQDGKIYGVLCSDETLTCNGTGSCQISNIYGECLKGTIRYYNIDFTECCTTLSADGHCTAVSTYDSSNEATVCLPNQCSDEKELIMGECLDICASIDAIRPNQTVKECVCPEGTEIAAGRCRSKCGSNFVRSEINPDWCVPLPCDPGFIRTSYGCQPCDTLPYLTIPFNPETQSYSCTEVCPNRTQGAYGRCFLSTCPEGYFHDDRNNCIPCDDKNAYPVASCEQCTNRTMNKGRCILTTCPEGYFHFDNDFYYDGTNYYSGDCVLCSIPPKRLQSSECDRCSNRVQGATYCQIPCNNGFYNGTSINATCVPCDTPSDIITDSDCETSCSNRKYDESTHQCSLLNCTENQIIWNHRCAPICGPDFIRDEDGNCVCPEGTYQLNNACGTWTSCTSNADCASDQYCAMKDESSGGCVTPPTAQTTTFTTHCNKTHTYVYTSEPMNYWSALNWCSWNESEMFHLDDLSLFTSPYVADTYTGLLSSCLSSAAGNYVLYPNEEWERIKDEFGSHAFWIPHRYGNSYFLLKLNNKSVDSVGVQPSDLYYPLCVQN